MGWKRVSCCWNSTEGRDLKKWRSCTGAVRRSRVQELLTNPLKRMREGKFELVAASTDKSFKNLKPFEERFINGSVYAVAIPGQEYCVKVNIYRDQNGNFTPKRLRIGLYVDGNDVQYWKRIDLTKEHLLPTAANVPVSATFWGFKKNVSDIRSFQFAATKASSNVACNRESDSKPLGQIHVVIYEAMVAGGTFKNKCGDHQVPTDQSIPEGKKFWEQASLSTSGGRKLPLNLEQFDELEKWINIDQKVPLHAMTLNYHTGMTLDCMESLCVDGIGLTGNKRIAGSFQQEQQQAKRECKINEVFDLTEDDDIEDDFIHTIESYEIQKSPDRALLGTGRGICETTIPDHDVLDSLHCEKCPSKVSADAKLDSLTSKQEHTDHDDSKSPVLKEEEEELIYEDEEKEILFVVPVPKEIICIDLMDDDDEDDVNNGSS